MHALIALAVDAKEIWVHRLYDEWHVHITTNEDGMKLEVKERGEDLNEVWDKAVAKFRRITKAAPELLPPRLAPPSEPEYTHFVPVSQDDDAIPF